MQNRNYGTSTVNAGIGNIIRKPYFCKKSEPIHQASMTKRLFLPLLLIIGMSLTVCACSPSEDPEIAEDTTPQPEPSPNPEPDTPTPQPDGEKQYLVVYFSRSGNTQAVASEISEQLDATLMEVVPTTAYPSDYNATLSRAREEISAIDNDGTYPSIETEVDSFDGYDVVFICTPLWYTRMSTPMQSFLNAHGERLAGKQLALAVTSSSSGITSVVADAHRLCPGSTFLGEALWVRASQISQADNMVREWIESLDLSNLQ